MSMHSAPCAYCIICAKPDELNAVSSVLSARFPEKAKNSRRDQPIHIVERVADAPPVSVLATCCSKMGHVHAASKTAQIISRYSPSLVLFVGTAASLDPEEIRLGDVVIPQHAFFRLYDKIVEKGEAAYEAAVKGRDFREHFFGDNALLSDVVTEGLSDAARNICAIYDGATELEDSALEPIWANKLKIMRAPKVERDVDILTCGMVVNSEAYTEFLRSKAGRKARVIDMESFGFFQALNQLRNLDVGECAEGLMVRGISDYGGRKEATEGRSGQWKVIATRNAAAVACDIIRQHSRT